MRIQAQVTGFNLTAEPSQPIEVLCLLIMIMVAPQELKDDEECENIRKNTQRYSVRP